MYINNIHPQYPFYYLIIIIIIILIIIVFDLFFPSIKAFRNCTLDLIDEHLHIRQRLKLHNAWPVGVAIQQMATTAASGALIETTEEEEESTGESEPGTLMMNEVITLLHSGIFLADPSELEDLAL